MGMQIMKRELKTAVVTGPTGAIGVALCERLLQEGLAVYAVCRPGSPRAEALPRNDRLHKVACYTYIYFPLCLGAHHWPRPQ